MSPAPVGPAAAGTPTALIAEDEPVLAQALQAQLAQAWPALRVLALAGDGDQALAETTRLAPDIVFLDIRMPGRSGLAVARALAEGLTATGRAPGWAPLVVFVTAYDQHAIEAFDAAAADYLLKPVSAERLARCVARLQARLSPGPAPAEPASELRALMQALAGLLPAAAASGVPTGSARLHFIRASLGDVIRQIPMDEVLYLEAQDKYVAVVTRDATALVRTPLADLLACLDPQRFVQIHRSTVVRVDAIDTIRRDLTGRQFVHLRERSGGREVRLAVSRHYAAQFRGL
jgi:DNA-binding LytR/AlgR family response regulator